MPLQDVSDVLDDADFSDFFDVVRPGVLAQDTGVPFEQDTTFNSVAGVVAPASSGTLQLLPEGSFQQGTITIITRFRLQTGSGVGYQADRVVWHGGTYTVVNVSDWSGYGSGFVQATATLTGVNPPGGPI